MKNTKKMISLRWKILIPIAIVGVCILLAAVGCLQYAIYTTGNNLLDMKLTSDLAKLTDNRITIDIVYKEGYEGVYSDAEMNINDSSVFDFSTFGKTQKEKLEKNGSIGGGYKYSPEENAFILEPAFRSDDRLIPRIDASFTGWHTGAPVVDLLFNMGSARFQTEKDGKTIGWLAVCQPGEPEDCPKMICIGTNGELVHGLLNYLSLVEGIALLLIIGVLIVIVLSIVSRTVRRIRKVEKYLGGVGAGNLPDELLVINSRDEIEDMTHIVNDMIIDLKEKQRIESELSMAANIQLSMLPKDFSEFSNRDLFDLHATMKPAKEVGGDFYDFFMTDETHLALIMADVSGKGVPAALFMVMGKTILRSAINADKDFSEIMVDVNKLLCSNNENGLFITVWAALLDLETGELTFCNAGHNPALLYHHDGEFEYLAKRHGTAMGLMDFVQYKHSTITMEPGDKLYLYTDGITEAQKIDEEMYGKERLLKCLNLHKDLSPKESLAAVKADVDEFVNGAEQFDDITMMMVQYIGKF